MWLKTLCHASQLQCTTGFTYEDDHDDEGSQVGRSRHPHADEAVMFSRHHVPQEPWRGPPQDIISLQTIHKISHFETCVVSLCVSVVSVLGLGASVLSVSVVSVSQLL